jgi:hypothetical protein
MTKRGIAELKSEQDEAYHRIARKYGLDASQDGPHNQIESKPAIETEVVDYPPNC